ncbi:MAG: hypothetical protein H0W43_08855 [Chthoniobacterales bacterium]|nr:hypothetical protein [Chthoniobacterales bacterium]
MLAIAPPIANFSPKASRNLSRKVAFGLLSSSQIRLFAVEFTEVYADYFRAGVLPGEHAVAVERTELNKKDQ